MLLGQLFFEQLNRQGNTVQGAADLMSKDGSSGANGGQALTLKELFLQLHSLGHIADERSVAHIFVIPEFSDGDLNGKDFAALAPCGDRTDAADGMRFTRSFIS